MKTFLLVSGLVLAGMGVDSRAAEFKPVCSRDFSIRFALERLTGKGCRDIQAADLAGIRSFEATSIETKLRAEDLTGFDSLEEFTAHKVANRSLVGVFSAFPGLRSLRLDFNGQEVVFSPSSRIEVFHEMEQLETLELRNLKIVAAFGGSADELQLYPEIVGDKLKLRQLVIRNSNVSYLSFHLFEDLPSLEVADFSYNPLDFFVGGIVDEARKLQVLALSGNPLTNVHGLHFPGLVSSVAVHVCDVAPAVVDTLRSTALPMGGVEFVTQGCL